jgi:quinol monooxygenase YgiN
MAISHADQAADGVEASGLDTGERIRWRERQFDRIVDGKINEPCPAGGRPSIVDQTQPEEPAVQIYQTAHYQVRLDAVDRVKTAIEEFVRYVTENEPGSRLYSAWQEVEDPTKFVHLFIFEDEAAHEAHGRSAAVRKFEDVYKPELTAGPVVFTDYKLVATNTW